MHPDDRGDADGCVEIVTVTGARPQFIVRAMVRSYERLYEKLLGTEGPEDRVVADSVATNRT